MTQKTLLSFFIPQNQKDHKRNSNSVEEEKERSADEESPIKTAKGKNKRLRIVSSGSENESDNEKKIVSEKSSSAIKKNTNQKLAKYSKEQDVKEFKISNANDPKSRTNDKKDEKEEELKVESKVPDSFFCNTQQDEKLGDKENNKVPHKTVECYTPASSKYDPIKDACWSHGQNFSPTTPAVSVCYTSSLLALKMPAAGKAGETFANPKNRITSTRCYHPKKVPYYALAKTFEEIEKESARLKMIEILSNFLRSVIVLSPEDLLPSIYLCLNRLGPAHESLELGLAEQTLIRAISQCTGRTVTQIRNESQEVGDLGLVAERSRSSQKLMFKPPPLTVAGIFKKFTEIANMTGKAAVNKKISTCETLFIACKGPEAKFLVRSLNGKLRIGLAEQSVLQAIALACASTPPGQSYPPKILNVASTMSAESFKAHLDELALILKTTYCECPDYGRIIPFLLKEGIAKLPEHCKITPGLPMKPMLAQPTKGVQDVLSRFDNMEFTCEWKYDGERAQIHLSESGEVSIFSRSQENYTTKYPDIISRIGLAKKEGVTSFILDCEAVAWDKTENRILPFQVLSTRKKKDATESDIKVPVCVFMFDILYLNGRPLVKEKFFERRRLLRENFNEVPGEWMFASSLDTTKMEEVQEFLEESIKMNCEGLMVKTLKEEATYEIAKRSRNWLKLKKDYLEGVGDTLDLVVLGGYLGKGKRTGTYGGYLIGCYDSDNEGYQSVCKLGTGFTEESLIKHAEFFKSHIIGKPPSYYHYDSSLEPDHWFEPAQVWETKCADLSLSPVHRAAIGVIDPEKGISLRFPRFLRVREDKRPEEATTAQEIIHLYKNQEQVKSQQNFSRFKEEDFY